MRNESTSKPHKANEFLVSNTMKVRFCQKHKQIFLRQQWEKEEWRLVFLVFAALRIGNNSYTRYEPAIYSRRITYATIFTRIPPEN